jgi:hypothetical protein
MHRVFSLEDSYDLAEQFLDLADEMTPSELRAYTRRVSTVPAGSQSDERHEEDAR